MIRSLTVTALAAAATLSFAAVSYAEDFPATPMNSGPPMMMPMAPPMAAPMAADTGMQRPMAKPMTMRQKRMMKKKMMMEQSAQ